MSDGRKRLSGYEYRKKAAEKKRKLEDVITKSAKLDSFVKKKEKQCESTNLKSLSTKTTSRGNLYTIL